MTPFEFVIPQRPVSQQTRRKSRLREWKEFVSQQARTVPEVPDTLIDTAVAINCLFLYDDAALDVDNIVKPIQDALVGIVLRDDSFVTDVIVRKRQRGRTFSLLGVSPTLAAAFDLGTEFVYVLISDAPNQDVLV